MMLSAEVAAPFGIVFVMDPESGVLPESLSSNSITALESAVAVGTLADGDGVTRFFLGEATPVSADGGLVLRWEGVVLTTGRIGIVSAENEVVVEMPAAERASVQIWTDDESEPEVVWIALPNPVAPTGPEVCG